MIDFSKPETIKYQDLVGDEGHSSYYRYALITTDTRTGKTTWYRSVLALADELCVEPALIVGSIRQLGRYKHLHFKFESDNFYVDAEISKDLVTNPAPYRDPLAPPKRNRKAKIYKSRIWKFTVLSTGYTEQCKNTDEVATKLTELLGKKVSSSLVRFCGLEEYGYTSEYKGLFKVTSEIKE